MNANSFKEEMLYVNMILPIAVDTHFVYSVQSSKDNVLGRFAAVPFKNTTTIGLIISINNDKKHQFRIREAIKILHELPAVHSNMIRFLEATARYNMYPVGVFYKMILGGMHTKAHRIGKFKINKAETADDKLPQNISLSPQQMEIASSISANLQQYCVHVLHGVTGSGKTETYLNVAKKVIDSGKQVLVLLPEILLSTQLSARFKKYFGEIGIWHSEIKQSDRNATWHRVQRGYDDIPMIKFVAGARSALYLPMHNIGLIIVDEEHDTSFKQEENPLYQARDMAILRAKHHDIPIILSSATPSIQTLYNAFKNKYRYYELTQKYSLTDLPHIQIADIRKNALQSMLHSKQRALPIIHSESLQEMQRTLHRGEQVMLFINRRGYANILMCNSCGARIGCQRCNVPLTYHKAKNIVLCHYCGYHHSLQYSCPVCNDANGIRLYGLGIEKVKEELDKLLPDHESAFLSSDLTVNKSANILSKIENGEIKIIVGTQILSKGFHFPNLQLIVVIDSSGTPLISDIRALEKTYQNLYQLIGRAGREKSNAKIILQTHEPTHWFVQSIINMDYGNFVKQEIQNRESASMPPFTKLCTITVQHQNEKTALQLIDTVENTMRSTNNKYDVVIMGASECPIFRLNSMFRYRIILQSRRNMAIQNFLNDIFHKHPNIRKKIKIDIDPYSFI
ncbi:Primosomal protein N' [Candidatus Fokinia solitaria]|uniref:Replication restart protein PriA n=1 Tax=Candidatus Fokinia solitaria TaxID=1802984 RepID=A0A2U8BT72_9RICK|nr:primosomal protein N' [Candidatus Fokinia solitaria]AWD33533.1 Primosomal protein N' [Candidatus Fokinia solitaria]